MIGKGAPDDPFLETSVVLPPTTRSAAMFDRSGDLIGFGAAGPVGDAVALAVPIMPEAVPWLPMAHAGSAQDARRLTREPRPAWRMDHEAVLSAASRRVLVGCGESKVDRGVSGAAIGAAAGAAGGALTGNSAVGGAVLGGAAGGAAGVLTDEEDVDLGKPAWRR